MYAACVTIFVRLFRLLRTSRVCVHLPFTVHTHARTTAIVGVCSVDVNGNRHIQVCAIANHFAWGEHTLTQNLPNRPGGADAVCHISNNHCLYCCRLLLLLLLVLRLFLNHFYFHFWYALPSQHTQLQTVR